MVFRRDSRERESRIYFYINQLIVKADLIEGIRTVDLTKIIDERGYFVELLRSDWKSLLEDDELATFSLSYSFPNVIRAWHRHLRGQNDYLICLNGSIKICVYDDRKASRTKGELDELILNGTERLQIVRIIGECWHGYKAIGTEPATILYGVTRLYNHGNPDEKRRPWDDAKIVPHSINGRNNDPRVGKPYDWNNPPHK